jgi:mevalonate kinase
LPTWDVIEEVRKLHTTENSRKAVIDIIRTLDEEAKNAEAPFQINNRRVEQWQRMLFRVSAFHYGSNDFSVVHTKAAQQVKWMWPSDTYEEHRQWFEITSAVADPVGAAISAVQALAFKKFEEIASTSSKNELTINLGTAIAEAERNLKKLGTDDPRIENVLKELQKAYAKIVNGEDPF